jgi:acetate kinase
VLNAGSSSLKFCVYKRPASRAWRLEVRGQIEGIGAAPRFSATSGTGDHLVDDALDMTVVRDGRTALDALAGWLRSTYGGARVIGVGHRVVHGGPHFTGPIIITPQVLDELRSLVPLAPLHQPHNIAAIDAVTERLPGVPQVACFDTSFHRGQPAVAELVPLPREVTVRGVQRYGFHGLSYEYIASVLPQVAPDIAHGRVIVAHLGSGASLCAMRNRKSIDSTFGFTALDGLCMGTRPGALDPGVVLFLFQNLGLTVKDVETMLYKKSGLLGISGTSNDMRDLLASPKPAARLAVDYFIYRATKEIGALAAVLGGLDALVFTAGIGENRDDVRTAVAEQLGYLGVGSRVPVHVVEAREELVAARAARALLS